MTAFEVYLISTADSLRNGAIAALFALLVGTVIAGLVSAVNHDLGEAEARVSKAALGWMRRGLVGAAAAMCLLVLTPSTKTLVAMYGIPAAINAAKSEAVAAVGEKGLAAVNKLLDDYLAEAADD